MSPEPHPNACLCELCTMLRDAKMMHCYPMTPVGAFRASFHELEGVTFAHAMEQLQSAQADMEALETSNAS